MLPNSNQKTKPSTLASSDLLIERGHVVALDADAIWVDPVARGACGHCSLRSGCGQHLLARLFRQGSWLRLEVDSELLATIDVGQQVEVGVQANAVLKAALAAYLLPVLGLLLGALVGWQWAQPGQGEWMSMALAALGFMLAGSALKWMQYRGIIGSEAVLLAADTGADEAGKNSAQGDPVKFC